MDTTVLQAVRPEKDNLCLYGLPNETWEVTLPPQEVPSELPEPTLGINFVRDGNTQKDWLSLVAAYSDSWLLAMAFYYGVRFGFDKEARRQLFALINSLPTVFDVVIGSGKKQHETPNDNSKNKPSSKPNSNSKPPKQPPPKYEEQIGKEDKGDEDEDYLCGICENSNGKFWIGCDVCEKRFHGECVHITARRQSTSSSTSAPVAAPREAESGHEVHLACRR